MERLRRAATTRAHLGRSVPKCVSEICSSKVMSELRATRCGASAFGRPGGRFASATFGSGLSRRSGLLDTRNSSGIRSFAISPSVAILIDLRFFDGNHRDALERETHDVIRITSRPAAPCSESHIFMSRPTGRGAIATSKPCSSACASSGMPICSICRRLLPTKGRRADFRRAAVVIDMQAQVAMRLQQRQERRPKRDDRLRPNCRL